MRADRLVGIASLVLGLCVAWGAHGLYVPYQYEPLGPKAFPFLVAGMLIVAAIPLLGKRSVVDTAMPAGPNTVPAKLCLLAILLVCSFFYERMGFVICTFACSAMISRCFAAPWRTSLITATLITGISYPVLVFGLGLQLPIGMWLQRG